MIDKTKLNGKNAFIKFAGHADARIIAIDHLDAGGVWFRDEVIALDLLDRTQSKGRPVLLQEKHPLTFVSYHGIEWLMFAEKDSH